MRDITKEEPFMFNRSAYELGTNGSVIRDLAAYGAERAKVVGIENVFDYSIGNPSIPAPKEVADTVRQLLEEDPMSVHGYTSAVGNYETRKAIADDLNDRFGADAKPEEFFIGCGSSPELVAVFRALCFPGAEFVAIAPYFPEYKPYVEEVGGTFKVVPPDLPDFQIDLQEVEAAVTEKTAAVIVNSPNNPSGAVYTEETLKALGALLTRKSREVGHPIYIVADEPYRELTYGMTAPFIPMLYPNTVVCYSYSKSLSLPGERIGYVYVPSRAADSREVYAAVCGAARVYGHICAPSLWQKVIARNASLRPDLESYDRNRRTLSEALIAMGYEMAKPDGAFYLFVKTPGGDANAFSEKAKQKDLLVVPGDGFGCPGYVRICYCVSHDKILRSLPVFQVLIEK
jgi:aspartate aminotransferase